MAKDTINAKANFRYVNGAIPINGSITLQPYNWANVYFPISANAETLVIPRYFNGGTMMNWGVDNNGFFIQLFNFQQNEIIVSQGWFYLVG